MASPPHQLARVGKWVDRHYRILRFALVAAIALVIVATCALLVIKPHPRDGHEKITRLSMHATRHFAEVVTLDDRWTFHLPFESVFVRYFPTGSRIRAATRVVCTSSAALSLEHLYGQECHLGFGPRAVRRCFAHNWKALRLRHEADLRAAIRQIRQDSVSAHAA